MRELERVADRFINTGRLNMRCIECNVRQVLQVCERLDIPAEQQEMLMRDVLAYLSTADYGKCNPEIMGETWKRILSHTQNKDPYKDVKQRFNAALLQVEPELDARITASADHFRTALKMAIAGNLIDFAARNPFTLGDLEQKLSVIETTKLAVDHGDSLRERLSSANTMLYLGDNCGEIVLDKLFLRQIHRLWPTLRLVFVVRGQPVINDVTTADALQVGMEEVAEVVSNGDGSLGTVMARVSPAFRTLFDEADVLIAKGQGNFESLRGSGKPGLFHLFMAKCSIVTKQLGVENHAILCAESNTL